MLLRQRAELEVLMVVRSATAHFASAMVFPGGVLDEADFDPLWDRFAHGAGLSAEDRALRICAFRELFEETGVLLGDKTTANPAMDLRGLVTDSIFLWSLTDHGANLDLDAMHPFARWITPEFAAKRFDTHFYLCGLETEVTPLEDGYETVAVEWITPARALALGAAKERSLMFPTRANLELLAQSCSVDDAIAAARARTIVPVCPTLKRDEIGDYLSIPEEAGYGAIKERDPI
jgi:8-oxo-dGTP pyrophosphatase MutT (NUDIX family)